MTTSTANHDIILIVDDEKIILDLTSIILRNRGYQVLTASDAFSALQVIEASTPDLVLLDRNNSRGRERG